MGGKSSGSKNTTTTQTQTLDPQMRDALFGSNGVIPAAQAQYAKGPADYYSGQTYTPYNTAQNNAVNGITDYANSAAANQGANAYSSVGSTLVDRLNQPQTYQASPYQSVTAAQAQGPSADYSGALTQALSGTPNNPWLDQQASGIMDQVNRNYNDNIAPNLRAGAMSAGQYGSSRDGVATGIAQSRANQDVTNGLANLYGNANAQAQATAAATAATLAGQQQQTNLANAGYQQQAGLANQNAYGNAVNTGLNASQFNTNAALQGAGALQTGASIPYTNYNQVLSAQSGAQADQNALNQSNLAAWDYNANKDMNYLKDYAGIVTPGAGIGGSSTTTSPMYKNSGSGMLGGALGGATLGSQYGGWGALGGGLLGGLLGGQ